VSGTFGSVEQSRLSAALYGLCGWFGREVAAPRGSGWCPLGYLDFSSTTIWPG
jgi:hypothetical protein